MKVEVQSKPLNEPQLMKFDGDSELVVLRTKSFDNYKFFNGVVIVGGNEYNPGTYRTDWLSCNFVPFSGTITLTQ